MTAEPGIRADVRRNRAALLEAGRALFERDGADMVFEDVARSAGVGKGTLYRHFPTRDHLVAALLVATFEHLAEAADELREQREPWEAYASWLALFDRMPAPYRGLQARLVAALQDDASVIAVACQPMKDAFGRLFARVQEAGLVRADLRAADLLSVVSGLPQGLRTPDAPHPYLPVILDGTRARSSPGSLSRG
ncbi:TetR/AcrR family transcriptional regulator [Gryllotalpicola reticulitermitis]|uniref:TetR/AcrR family transcriptional regulator n=1 Tax=Gryllotalpicola reticulitermitis TaxID=1184153 RepID=A0ABV8Q456_9MICO